MTAHFRLAHISDLHLTPVAGLTPRYWNVKRGLGYLNWLKGRRDVHCHETASRLLADVRAQAVDHLAVTGDLTNLGLPAEFDWALDWLAAQGDQGAITVVPGNHDIYTRRMHGASCLDTWSAYMTSCALGRELADGASMFPLVRRFGNVALIGVNSAIPRAPFIAAGCVGDAQRQRLARTLEAAGRQGLLRVVLIHHPPLPGQAPRSRALDDAAEFEATIAQHGAELVLHGHNHQDMKATIASARWGEIPVVGVGSGSARRAHKHEPLASYKIYSISGIPGAAAVEVETRGLETAGGAVQKLRRETMRVVRTA